MLMRLKDLVNTHTHTHAQYIGYVEQIRSYRLLSYYEHRYTKNKICKLSQTQI